MLLKKLRFSTKKPMGMLGIFNPPEDHAPLAIPNDLGELVEATLKGRTAYIHGQAENLACFDIPVFLDGDMAQLDLPVAEQDIVMILPAGEYKCKAVLNDGANGGDINVYYITLFNEK